MEKETQLRETFKFLKKKKFKLSGNLQHNYTPQEQEDNLLSLMKSWAFRLAPKSVHVREDLFQEGYIAYLKMKGGWDREKGMLRTYCQRRIIGAMQDHLRNTDFVPRLERRRLKDGSIERVATLEVSSLDLTKFTSEFSALTNKWSEIFEVVSQSLSNIEAFVVELYYYYDVPMKLIGGLIDLSESRVSQMLSKVMENLRKRDLGCLLKRNYTGDFTSVPPFGLTLGRVADRGHILSGIRRGRAHLKDSIMREIEEY